MVVAMAFPELLFRDNRDDIQLLINFMGDVKVTRRKAAAFPSKAHTTDRMLVLMRFEPVCGGKAPASRGCMP